MRPLASPRLTAPVSSTASRALKVECHPTDIPGEGPLRAGDILLERFPMGRRFRRNRGTAIVLAIVLSVVITGLVSALAWVAGQQAQSAGSLSKLDQAFFAAEAGAQRVAWYCKNGGLGVLSSPLTGTINGYNYSTSWTWGSVITVTSVGSTGNVAYTLTMRVNPAMPPASAMATAGDFDGKNMKITGNVVAGGDFTDSGSGSVTGNLNYYGAASGTGAVSGTITQSTGAFLTVNMDAIGTTLIAAAGLTYNSPQNGTVFDFTMLPGTNKVIYVNGNVTNPIFIGTGTLYVNGTVGNVNSFGTLIAPVNVVATDVITINNNTTFFGSFYTKKDWVCGKFDLTGLVYAEGTSRSNSGMSSLVMGTVPFFDPRGANGGNGTSMSIAGVAGPQP